MKTHLVFAAILLFVAMRWQGPLEAQENKPIRVTRTFSANAKDPVFKTQNLLGFGTVCDKDGRIRLVHSELFAREVGATDFRQVETLAGKVQAKTTLVIFGSHQFGGYVKAPTELLFYGNAREVMANGKRLAVPQPLVSTGWSRVKIDPALLEFGRVEVIFKDGQLLIQPDHPSWNSEKSSDGGKTWNPRLGTDNNQKGDYVVRLRAAQYPVRGWAISQVFDLWAERPGSVATPGRLRLIPGQDIVDTHQPPYSSVTTLLRTGPTPSPDETSWTGWIPLNKEYRPNEPADRHRWAQLQWDLLNPYPHRQVTPRLPAALRFNFDLHPDSVAQDRIKVKDPGIDYAGSLRTSTPFTYQAPSPRLKLLRERYKLDQVIALGKTEMEQFMLLRYWVRNQWHTAWGSHPAAWMPPWDSLIILASKDQPDCLTMCTHYACVFTQCCLALGWDARHCILDHHCVAEVYSREHDRWVMMDAGNSAERADVGLHFERGGVPLSARELHLAHRTGKTVGITVHFTPAKLAEKVAKVCRPAPVPKNPWPPRPDVIPLAELGKYPVCQLNNYRRYAIPPRNNYLTTLVPGELEQGWSEYFYDGYYWVGDSPDDPQISPEYSHHLAPNRPQDVDWKLGWTHIHLCRTAKPGELQVDLETNTPNLARLERLGPDGKAQPTPARFLWTLRPGHNELAVRSVNHWDKLGRTAKVVVSYEPAGK
jgi:hypothetical protein